MDINSLTTLTLSAEKKRRILENVELWFNGTTSPVAGATGSNNNINNIEKDVANSLNASFLEDSMELGSIDGDGECHYSAMRSTASLGHSRKNPKRVAGAPALTIKANSGSRTDMWTFIPIKKRKSSNHSEEGASSAANNSRKRVAGNPEGSAVLERSNSFALLASIEGEVAESVKATMPLFTVILSRLILKEKQTLLVYLSLIPIISGVGIATVTELSFNMLGLVCALISTMGFSLQNIFSKKVLKDTGIHHLRLLHVLGRWALLMFLPIWFYFDFFSIIQHNAIKNVDYRVITLLFTDGVLNWLQNIIAFSVLSLVPPLTYAVASASKRIFVIGVSLFILGNPVTWVNLAGMTLAVTGVLCYNRAKHVSKLQIVLPYTNSQWIKYNPLQNTDTFYQNGKTQFNGTNARVLPNNNTTNNSNKLLFV